MAHPKVIAHLQKRCSHVQGCLNGCLECTEEDIIFGEPPAVVEGVEISVAAAPVQSQLKPEAEPSLAEAQPELLSDGSHISANSGSG